MINYVKSHLSIKIFILGFILTLAISGITYGFISYYLPVSYSDQMDKDLNSAANLLTEELSKCTLEEGKVILKQFCIEHNVIIHLYDSLDNKIDYGSNSDFQIAPISEHSTDNLLKNEKYGITKKYSVRFKGESQAYKITMLGDRQEINMAMIILKRIFPKLCILTLILSFLIAFLSMRYLARPMLKVSEVSGKISNMDFKVRCPMNRIDEIGILSVNLNELAQRIDQTLEKLTRANERLQDEIGKEKELEKQQMLFFSAVSHELKTPITVLKGQIEGMIYQVGGYKDRDKYLRRSHEVVLSMETLVQELLDVTMLKKSDIDLRKTYFFLHELVSETMKQYEELFFQNHLSYEMEISPEYQIYADRKLISKVFGNLIGNAARYTPEGNRVLLCSRQENGKVFLIIENEGVHIPEEEIEKLFEPFYRPDKSRNKKTGGSGLGLYIVRIILEQHNFSYQMKNTEKGVEVRIWF